jgi:membrane peptidoglycan carboxypeptidase
MPGHGRGRRRVALLAAFAVLTTGCGGVVTLEVPSADDLALTPRRPAIQSVVYDADGRQLATLRREYREPLSLSAIPSHVVGAILMAEDRRFYDHQGVDLRAIARAALANHTSGTTQQGGSTITQQLVKNLYMPEDERSGATKLREAVLARELERRRPKADILEDYLNTVYFGEGAHGIGAAAWTYFRAEVEDLDLAQAALLAAIIRAPERLAPTRAPEEAQLRRDDVLERLAQDGWITAAERDAALATPIQVEGRPPAPATREPHFVDLVVRTVLADPRFGATEAERATRLYEGGLHLHTTLRPELQQLARDTLDAHLPDADDPDAAVAMVDPATGHVLAAVGNRAYDELQFDLATQARRQPGSTFKTFVLASAIADGWHPDDTLDGRQGVVRVADGGGWEVRNYDRRSYPQVTLTEATRASVNTAYARLGVELGVSRVAGLANAMGVRSPLPEADPQLTIGGGQVAVTPLDLAAAYGTLANLGVHVPTTVIARVEDGEGNLVLEGAGPPQAALAPSAAFVTTEVLREVVERGTALNAQVEGWEVAGKTGTTSDHADAWFVGYTPVLSAAVWLGHVEGRIPLEGVQGVRQVTGGTIPARIFSAVVTGALEGVTPVSFELPDDEYQFVEIDPESGLRAAEWCPGEVERRPKVLVPKDTCPEPPPPPPAPSPTPTPTPSPTPTTVVTVTPIPVPAPVVEVEEEPAPPEPVEDEPEGEPEAEPAPPDPGPVEDDPPAADGAATDEDDDDP